MFLQFLFNDKNDKIIKERALNGTLRILRNSQQNMQFDQLGFLT